MRLVDGDCGDVCVIAWDELFDRLVSIPSKCSFADGTANGDADDEHGLKAAEDVKMVRVGRSDR